MAWSTQEPIQALGEEDHIQVFGKGDGDGGQEVSSTVGKLPTEFWPGNSWIGFAKGSSSVSQTGEGSNIYWG